MLRRVVQVDIWLYFKSISNISLDSLAELINYIGGSDDANKSKLDRLLSTKNKGLAFAGIDPEEMLKLLNDGYWVSDLELSERQCKSIKQLIDSIKYGDDGQKLIDLKRFLQDRNIDFHELDPDNKLQYEDFFERMIRAACGRREPPEIETSIKPCDVISVSTKKIVSSFNYGSPFFVGRDRELEEIDKCLNENRIVFLSGIGGIGKSELAKKYALKYKDKYSTVSFGIINDDNDSLLSLICNDNYISVSDLSIEKGEDIRAYFNRKLSLLRSLANESNLIIMDNLNNIYDEDLSVILSVPCKFIFTTRCSLKQINYPAIEIKRLEKDGEVRRLFYYYYTSDISEEEKSCVDKILQLVDYHTITVEILAKTMDNGDFLPSEMLSKLKDAGLVSINEEDVSLSYSGSNLNDNAINILKSIFDINNLSSAQKSIMNYLALIPPQGIKRNRFKTLCNLSNSNDINHLISLGWIKRNDVTNHISLHPVVSEIISSYGNITFDNCKSFICALEKYISSCEDEDKADAFEIAKYAPLRIQQASAPCYSFLNACLDLLDNAADISAVEPICILLNQIANENSCSNDERIKIFQRIGLSYKSFTLYKSAIKYMQRSIECVKNGCTLPLEEIAEVYRDLGNVYKRITNHLEALKMYEMALQIRKDLYGEDHIEIGKSYNNIGVSYTKNDQPEKALNYHKKALKIIQNSQKIDSGLIAWTYNCMGIAELRLGNADMAIELHSKALKLYDVNNPTNYLAYTYWDLGEAYRKKQAFKNALDYHNKALDIREHLYGKESRDVAVSLSQIADVFAEQGNYEEAIVYAKKALEMRIGFLGEKAWDVAWSYHSLADIYLKKEDYYSALEYYTKAMNIRTSLAGEDNISMVYTYLGLGDACNKLENEFAEEYYKKALIIANELLPNDHKVIKELNQKLNNA